MQIINDLINDHNTDYDFKLFSKINNFNIKIELERQNSVCSNFIKKNILH